MTSLIFHSIFEGPDAGYIDAVISGMVRRTRPGISRFRVRFAPRNDVETLAFSRRCAPELMLHSCPSKYRGRREGRAPAGTHGPRAEKSTRQNHRLSRGYRPSLRNGFNGLLRALPGDRALLPPSPARCVKRLCELSASVGAPGPHGLAVREAIVRPHSKECCDPSRPPLPASTSVTIAKRPSARGGMQERCG
jgi:hypothetical protein